MDAVKAARDVSIRFGQGIFLSRKDQPRLANPLPRWQGEKGLNRLVKRPHIAPSDGLLEAIGVGLRSDAGRD
jgi:hypothetical protein